MVERVADHAEGAQCDADRPGSAEPASERELLLRERERFVALAERRIGHGGLRAPVGRGGIRLVHHLLALADLEHVGERGARVTLREAQAGARVQEHRAGVAVADRAGRPMCVGALERGLGGSELAALGERLHERGRRPEDDQPAGVPVGREGGLGVDDGVAERSGAEAGVRTEREQRPDAVVGLLPTGVVDPRREDPLRVVEAIGQRQAAHREPDHDGQDRVGAHRVDRPLRQDHGALRRFAGHGHLGGGDQELQRAVELTRLDALA